MEQESTGPIREAVWGGNTGATKGSRDRQSRHYFTELAEHFGAIANFDLPKAFILSRHHE